MSLYQTLDKNSIIILPHKYFDKLDPIVFP